MSKKIYFFRTILEGNKNRLRPMPFQTDDNGRTLITDLNVQADTEKRQSYPIGTIFASESIDLRTGTSQTFYAAGDIYPVSIQENDLKSPNHRPTDKMRSEYTDYMTKNGLSAETINKDAQNTQGIFSENNTQGKTLSLLQKIKNNPRFAAPTVENDGFWVNEKNWWTMILSILENDSILLTGPAGTGKTQVVKLLSEKLGLKLHIFDMGSMYDPISELLGVHRISSNGTSVFEYASFTQAIQEEGIILLDELSRATPAVNNILLPCLDDRRELPVEMAGATNKRRIKIHPKCRFIATANIGAEYTGVQGEMDRALTDRFLFVETEYMPSDKEALMLVSRYKIGKADAINIVNTANVVRNLAQSQEVQTSLTTRETIRAAIKVHQGFSAKEAMELVFLPLYSGTKADGERAVIWNAILAN